MTDHSPVLRNVTARVLHLPVVHAALPQVRQTALVHMPGDPRDVRGIYSVDCVNGAEDG